jgi:ubiquinone/menaquinone biosynthesis C-methylase UbiE
MQKALEEMRRVLKPTGLYFVNTELLQKRSSKGTRLDKSLWKEVAGGCNLNRNIPQIIKIAVLKILN